MREIRKKPDYSPDSLLAGQMAPLRAIVESIEIWNDPDNISGDHRVGIMAGPVLARMAARVDAQRLDAEAR